jgi:hypothetical protein
MHLLLLATKQHYVGTTSCAVWARFDAEVSNQGEQSKFPPKHEMI